MNKLIGLCCVLFGIACAYEFDDAFYNQILANDLEELSLESDLAPSHPRVRRDEAAAKCHKRHHHHACCGEEELQVLHEKFRDIKKECFKQVTGKEFHHGPPRDPFNCDNIEKMKKDMICIKQCEGQKKGIMDNDGNIKEEEVKKFIKETVQMEWLKPKLDDIITKCIAEAKEAAAKRDVSDKEACNPSDLKLGHCMFREIQLGCPADQIKDQDRCDKVREWLKKDPLQPHH